MCGICGFVSLVGDGFGGEVIDRMSNTLEHRGPDDSGSLWARGEEARLNGRSLELSGVHPEIGLGHTRLAIVDLSRLGRQPMSNESGSLWITYNGEVYNHAQIRSELEGKGYRFRSKTDTEVVICAYEEWGEGCLARFNGMFAFAIYDTRDRSLFVARDRLGIKPVYWIHSGEKFAFSSEVKAFLELDWFRPEVDSDGLMSHLLLLWPVDPKTIFAGVEKLPAGHWLRWKDGEVKSGSYWDVSSTPRTGIKEKEAIEELDQLMQTSVDRRMMSDVPVGAFLSGGLDSSLIAALMARKSSGPVSTYTIAFEEEDQAFEAMPDDSRYAKQVAEHIGADHNEIRIQPDIAELLPNTIWHLDEPIADPAAINTYLISSMAKAHGSTVLLSGMGADEVFAGYRKHLSVRLAGIYKRFLPSFVRKGIVEPLAGALPVAGEAGGYRLFRWAKRFARSASMENLECFIGNYTYYNHKELAGLLSDDLKDSWRDLYPVRRHYETAAAVSERDFVSQMTYLDTKLFLPGLNLAYSDKASMAAAVEVRVPFVDHEVVSFAASLPSSYHLRGITQKYLLKKVALRYLPRDIVYRPKAPFGAPLRSWMHRGLSTLVDDLLSEASIRTRGLFKPAPVRRMITDNRAGKHDYGHRIWSLLTLEIWHRMFIDRTMHPSEKLAVNATREGAL
jgi:asparagine synthase (glutamine-hydrolysing)